MDKPKTAAQRQAAYAASGRQIACVIRDPAALDALASLTKKHGGVTAAVTVALTSISAANAPARPCAARPHPDLGDGSGYGCDCRKERLPGRHDRIAVLAACVPLAVPCERIAGLSLILWASEGCYVDVMPAAFIRFRSRPDCPRCPCNRDNLSKTELRVWWHSPCARVVAFHLRALLGTSRITLGDIC